MDDVSGMVISSLSKIWHIVPIVIFIILFKKYITKKDKKRRINLNEENDKKGLSLEVLTAEKYEKMGYEVTYPKTQDGKKVEGINMICTKNDKILLIQCNNSSEPKSITDDHIKTFYKNANEYLETNNIEKKHVEFRFVIHYNDVLDKYAMEILTNGSYNCKYVVI